MMKYCSWKRLIGCFVLAVSFTEVGLFCSFTSLHGSAWLHGLSILFIPIYALGGLISDQMNLLKHLSTPAAFAVIAITQGVYAYLILSVIAKYRRRSAGEAKPTR